MGDPDFDHFLTKEAAPSLWDLGSLVRWVALALALIVAFPFLLIGIKPFSTSASLNRPIGVNGVTSQALILEDGTLLPLPLITRIPLRDPVLEAVLARGVEREPGGEVYGLLTVYPSCGMTAYRHITHRVNLSDLVAVLDPNGLDGAKVAPEAIQFLAESVHRHVNPGRVKDYFLHDLRRAHEILEPARNPSVAGELRS